MLMDQQLDFMENNSEVSFGSKSGTGGQVRGLK